ncbi:MAG: DUF4331 domain-containing protein [Myxococcota bacterium]|nr:DUF4331 domain-containing protein [Myxococcota bacterium]
MRYRTWLAGLIAVTAVPLTALAADHLDFTGAEGDPTADITDLYAWTSDDASTVRLVLGVAPFATAATELSTATQYVFHITNGPAFGATTGTEERRIVCQPYDDMAIECWVLAEDGTVLDYVSGEATAAAGVTSDSGDVRLFAGARNDPFFFNLDGFNTTRSTVLAAAPSLTFDPAGCPAVDAATSAVLVEQLQSDADGTTAIDDFAGANILAIVLEIDKSLLTRTGNEVLAIWASTHRSPS